MTPAGVLSAHAWNSITGRCACGGWEGNRVDHGAHQIEQLAPTMRRIIAGGIHNYCTGHYCEPDADGLDRATMQQVYDDADSIADYIVDGALMRGPGA